MYTLFVQKQRGDGSPFPLTEQLHHFLFMTKANGIFVSPGHLSSKVASVENLLDAFLKDCKITKFGIGNKYGGNFIPIYEDYLNNHGILWNINRNGNSDHRKMVFILRYKDPLDDQLDIQNYEQIVGKIEVLGVAIGSSNFSFITYGSMTPGSEYANKGEADILMFFDEGFRKHIVEICRNEPNNTMVLSESVTRVPEDFLKRMFLETLRYTLA